WINKRWPAEFYARVVRKIVKAHPEVRFAILGGMDDQESGHAIATAAPGRALDLTGRTSLPEMIEWIRRCDLVVSNDTGPMHVAAKEISYHATSGTKDIPPGSLLEQCTGRAVAVDAFDASRRIGLLQVAFPLKMLLQPDGHLTSTDLLHTTAGAILFDIYENQ